MRTIFTGILLLAGLTVFSQKPNSDSLALFYPADGRLVALHQQQKLDSIIALMKHHAALRITIDGYTDYKGTTEKNQKLSNDRARNVAEYLLTHGISEEFIVRVEGHGELPPVLDGLEEVPANRKVEVWWEWPIKKPSKSVAGQVSAAQAGDHLVIKNLNFQPGRHYLTRESIPTLNQLLKVMRENPSLKIEIQGHICCDTTVADGYDIDAKDWKLSTNRAKAIYEYLINKGIDESRLSYKGFGRTQPLIKIEQTVADENKNRRVEILIIER